MSLRTILSYILIFIVSFVFVVPASAQKVNTDSTAAARKRILDSTNNARKQYYDSLRAERLRVTDSMRAARKIITDSLTRIREYRASKFYKDSVADVRQKRTDSIKAVRTAYIDSVRAERQRVTDSTIVARKTITDSIRAVQKKRSDSLGVIRAYRQSKRYGDSVAVVRQARLDSIKAERKAFNDSVATVRKHVTDSMTAARKAYNDSVIAVRTKFTDSLKAARKVRTDSLAKIKEQREKDQKTRAKLKEEKMQLALELKINKKREAWSNEKMLKKKWGIPRQIVQNTFTRYNYYFNTDKKMDEALDNMQRAARENYDSVLALFPFDPDRDSALLSQDMDSIIQKASVGIQIHDPRTKWGDDLYLLMGQAYYYKADYDNAATAFRYTLSLRDKNKKKNNSSSRSKPSSKVPSIAQADNNKPLDFLKHRSVHNEALLWLARTYTEWKQDGNAESVLDLLETDPNFPKSLKGRLALERAYLALSQNDRKVAIKNLDIVATDNELPDWVRTRAAYINGQLLEQQGDYAAAAESFKKVVALHPKIEMDFYARKNTAFNQLNAGVDQDEALSSLKRVLNDGKYSNYYEQIYYVMGRLAASNNRNDEAIVYFQKGLHSLRSTKKQKALSFAALGNIYYNQHNYSEAKNYYDSAAGVASAAANDTDVIVAVKRGSVLGLVTEPAGVIHVQDSLLVLAAMSEKDQRSVVRKYIRALEKQRNDSIFRAENGLNNAPVENNNDPNAPSYVNWYFANPVLMQRGINDFKRKWGSRTLADNWRRSAAMSGFANNNAQANNQEAVEEGALELDENGIPTEDALLALIPKTDEQKAEATQKVKAAYMDMANAYIKQLEDYPQGTATLDTFEKRYPEKSPRAAEALYLRYLAAIKQNQLDAAKTYSTQLLQEYGDSKWAALVRPTEDDAGLVQNNTGILEYYDNTYNLMLQRQYNEVLQLARDGQKKYSDSNYIKRFRIIEAIALAGTGNYDMADTIATTFIRNYPADSLKPWADAVLDFIKKNRVATATAAPPAPVSSAPAAIVPPTAVSTTGKPIDSTAAAKGQVMADTNSTGGSQPPPATYTYKPKEEHYAVFSFNVMEQRAMGVKAAMGDFNSFKFPSMTLKSEAEMLSNDKGLIITRKFANALQAKIYLNMLRATPQVFREYKDSEYELFTISAENYRKLKADKDYKTYINFYKSNYK